MIPRIFKARLWRALFLSRARGCCGRNHVFTAAVAQKLAGDSRRAVREGLLRRRIERAAVRLHAQ
jgi:hypothetical protein